MVASSTRTPEQHLGWNELDLTHAISEAGLTRLLTAGKEPSTLLYGAASSGKTSAWQSQASPGCRHDPVVGRTGIFALPPGDAHSGTAGSPAVLPVWGASCR